MLSFCWDFVRNSIVQRITMWIFYLTFFYFDMNRLTLSIGPKSISSVSEERNSKIDMLFLGCYRPIPLVKILKFRDKSLFECCWWYNDLNSDSLLLWKVKNDFCCWISIQTFTWIFLSTITTKKSFIYLRWIVMDKVLRV